MIYTQDEVLTSGSWSINCEGASKANVDDLGDKWDGF